MKLAIDGAPALEGSIDQPTSPPGGYAAAELAAFAGDGLAQPMTVLADNWIVQSTSIGCP